MPVPSGYALVDAGDGRRLEQFGGRLVDRPAPGVVGSRRAAPAWSKADLRFDPDVGWQGDTLDPWRIRFDDLTLELRPTDAGQVGLFPEHAALWPWLIDEVARAADPEVLNLFAHTGATTLALARAGARVVHVDGSKPALGWARRNAELSGLDGAAIRWLRDDAVSFAGREIRRERVYRGIVLDPPAYGHAVGRAWRLDDDLLDLLRAAVRLLDRPGFILLTTHSVGWDTERLAGALSIAADAGRPESGRLELRADSGATLGLGAFARVIIDR